MRRIRVIGNILASCLCTFLSLLPNDRPFCLMRLWVWRKMGYDFGEGSVIFGNVIFRGLVKMGHECSISNNCFISGWTEGIFIGDHVMIAPNCVLAAFNHGFSDTDTPMIEQPWQGAPITIEDDVWIAANCTITAGVRIGKGSIIGANSVVTKDIPAYSITGGVPAKILGCRTLSAVEAEQDAKGQ